MNVFGFSFPPSSCILFLHAFSLPRVFHCLPSLLPLLEVPELHSLSHHMNSSLQLCIVMPSLTVQLLTLSETQPLPHFVCRANAAMW